MGYRLLRNSCSRLGSYAHAYGYLWWVNEDGYAAMGDGGNIIYVNTKKKLVVSIAAFYIKGKG